MGENVLWTVCTNVNILTISLIRFLWQSKSGGGSTTDCNHQQHFQFFSFSMTVCTHFYWPTFIWELNALISRDRHCDVTVIHKTRVYFRPQPGSYVQLKTSIESAFETSCRPLLTTDTAPWNVNGKYGSSLFRYGFLLKDIEKDDFTERQAMNLWSSGNKHYSYVNEHRCYIALTSFGKDRNCNNT